ncbi:hypothetical protein [Candidatus Amarolinea dominans]|uniref:hypothetical protein n=1 Tax=Candidatus Amarolinea dominans TaxID=3140696 RepID=UPI0031CC8AFD
MSRTDLLGQPVGEPGRVAMRQWIADGQQWAVGVRQTGLDVGQGHDGGDVRHGEVIQEAARGAVDQVAGGM